MHLLLRTVACRTAYAHLLVRGLEALVARDLQQTRLSLMRSLIAANLVTLLNSGDCSGLSAALPRQAKHETSSRAWVSDSVSR